MVVRVRDVQRLGEVKVPAGSAAVDREGRFWSSDVAGHVARFNRFGKQLVALKGSPKAADINAQLPFNALVPAIVRSDGKVQVWVLYTLTRKLVTTAPAGKGERKVRAIPATVGRPLALIPTPAGPLVIGDQGAWKP